MSIRRFAWLALGLSATALGLLGAVLPLLPTTPFLLLAALAFSRSSPRLHSWLVNHPRYGTTIRNWQTHRAIGGRAKAASVVAMLFTLAISIAIGLPALVLTVQAVVLLAVGAFVLTRAAPPASEPSGQPKP